MNDWRWRQYWARPSVKVRHVLLLAHKTQTTIRHSLRWTRGPDCLDNNLHIETLPTVCSRVCLSEKLNFYKKDKKVWVEFTRITYKFYKEIGVTAFCCKFGSRDCCGTTCFKTFIILLCCILNSFFIKREPKVGLTKSQCTYFCNMYISQCIYCFSISGCAKILDRAIEIK